MNFIRRVFFHTFRPFDRRRGARARSGYDAEVLFAGWVDLPKALRELKAFKLRK